jgi:hypothetical protein
LEPCKSAGAELGARSGFFCFVSAVFGGVLGCFFAEGVNAAGSVGFGGADGGIMVGGIDAADGGIIDGIDATDGGIIGGIDDAADGGIIGGPDNADGGIDAPAEGGIVDGIDDTDAAGGIDEGAFLTPEPLWGGPLPADGNPRD